MSSLALLPGPANRASPHHCSGLPSKDFLPMLAAGILLLASARRRADAILGVFPPRALLVAGWALYTPLLYLQETERRQDVLLFEMPEPATQAIRENVARRPLFLADVYPRYYPMAELTESLDLEPVGPVFQLAPWGGDQ